MKKKLLTILKWSLLGLYFLLMLGFASKKRENIVCTKLSITVDSAHKFANQESIEKMLLANNIKIDSCIIDNLNFDQIEKLLESDPYIKKAEVYSKFDGELNIYIKQRNPVMRIITTDNNSYYIDDQYNKMPVCMYYSANVVVVSGEISEDFITKGFTPEVINKKECTDVNLHTIYEFVNFINQNPLWKSQFEQIYINEDNEIELVPRVGNHVIILGNLKDYKYKLWKLEALYKNRTSVKDWNIYSTINLKYSDQIICKKR